MKTKLTQQQLSQLLALYNQDYGSRKIAKIMGVNRSTIIRAYRQLELDSFSKKTPRYAYKQIEKSCATCEKVKLTTEFRKRWNEKTNRASFESSCLDCEKIYSNERAKKQAKILRKTDPNYVIRKSLSYFIWRGLKKNKSTKGGESCLLYLNYTIPKLRAHLEKLFESWMNWSNYGGYKKSGWDDNDPSTWKWSIDHIIPQSDLSYTSMKDENFKKCWSLDNLRPLNAKQNYFDGLNKIRHKNL